MTTMTATRPTFREALDQARERGYDKLEEKALKRARRRGHSLALIKVTGRQTAEAMVSRGWSLDQAHGQPTIFDINQTFTLHKKVLGRP